MHDFASVTFIGLQQKYLGIFSAARAGAVVKDAFGAVAKQIFFIIAGQRLAKFLIVGGEVAVDVHGASKHNKIIGR